jgi:ADP-ribose pyrophosphatase YjhB (NUDIX family)
MKCRPKAEIGVYILNYDGDKILLGKNKFENFWRIINGKLGYGESFDDCACRILAEQLNFKVNTDRVKFLCSLNVMDKNTKFHCLEINYFIQITEKEEIELSNLRSLYCQLKLFNIEDLNILKDEIFFGILVFLKKYNISSLSAMKNVVSN